MDSNAFLNDLMSKMKLPEAKGKKKAEQSESVAQILAVMPKVKTEKKKPPVTSYAPVKEIPARIRCDAGMPAGNTSGENINFREDCSGRRIYPCFLHQSGTGGFV